MKFWGYMDQYDQVQVKTGPFRSEDDNSLVKKIVPPFKADSFEEAKDVITERVKDDRWGNKGSRVIDHIRFDELVDTWVGNVELSAKENSKTLRSTLYTAMSMAKEWQKCHPKHC
jgi:hypothetical protein